MSASGCPSRSLTSADDDPARKAEMADSLSLAFLVLLESLSPEQRAAFLLREVFDEPYDRIAEIVGTSEQNARQLATRARRHVRGAAPAVRGLARAARAARDPLLRGRRGGRSRKGWRSCWPHDVVLHGDGGGKAPATRTCAPRPRQGGARADAGLRAGRRRFGGFTVRREEVNGQPGALFFDRDGRLASVMTLDIADGQIQAVSSIVNPDKLRHLGPVADLRALLRSRS